MFKIVKKINLLFSLIDSIREDKDTIYIKTKKNILIENSGHVVNINKGYSIVIAKEIHLNPNINLRNNLDNIEDDIERSKVIQICNHQ